MLRIKDCKTIEIIKGDKGFLNFRCANYKLKAGDTVKFIIEALGVEIEERTFNPEGVAVFEIDNVHTHNDAGTYDYRVRVITANGIDETAMEGKFVILP